ncbi:MAG: hypothetical protein Q4F21_08260 [Lachnospiraceae bacterium]|nr:hypothetical protein [Lachnospiraceae bacterium]
MKDKSTIGWYEYLAMLIAIGIIVMIQYKILFFRPLPGRSYTESMDFLRVMFFASIILNTLLFRYRKTNWTIAISLLLPLGVFTSITYQKTVGPLIRISIIVAVSLSVIYTIYLMSKKIKNRKNVRKILLNRFYQCFWFVQSAFTVAAIVILTSIYGSFIFNIHIMNSQVTATIGEKTQKQTISNNMDTILLLQSDEWEQLTTQDKLDVLQCVANIEAQYLGLPTELNVEACSLKKDQTGTYTDLTHVISVDIAHLENSGVGEVLNTVLHEAYHSYQHRLVDVYNNADKSTRNLRIFSSAATYEKEFKNYSNGRKDIDAYFNQACEEDCRKYAELGVRDYYEKIEKYLNIEKDRSTEIKNDLVK